jgi:hypothetical protein
VPVNHCGEKGRIVLSRALEFRTEKEQCSLYVLDREVVMLRIFVEEAAALTSIALFVGMIAVWAQLLTAL